MPRAMSARGIAGTGVRILGMLALLLALFLVVGLFLPRRVEVSRSTDLSEPPQVVFPYLSDLERWTAWTPWGDVESRIEGPTGGEGATRTWDDPTFGSGSLTLTEVAAPSRVSYEARVEGGVLFEGLLELEPMSGGSRLTWTESVSWGWNPLLGWNGLTLDDAQGRQLEEALARLREVAGSPPPGDVPSATADTVARGAS